MLLHGQLPCFADVAVEGVIADLIELHANPAAASYIRRTVIRERRLCRRGKSRDGHSVNLAPALMLLISARVRKPELAAEVIR